jgi:hypothetical protein
MEVERQGGGRPSAGEEDGAGRCLLPFRQLPEGFSFLPWPVGSMLAMNPRSGTGRWNSSPFAISTGSGWPIRTRSSFSVGSRTSTPTRPRPVTLCLTRPHRFHLQVPERGVRGRFRLHSTCGTKALCAPYLQLPHTGSGRLVDDVPDERGVCEAWGNPFVPESPSLHWGPLRPTDIPAAAYNQSLQHYGGKDIDTPFSP